MATRGAGKFFYSNDRRKWMCVTPRAPHKAPTKGTPTMANTYVPESLTLMEAACVNWTLAKIKIAILAGTPSGKVIDQAIDEALKAGTKF